VYTEYASYDILRPDSIAVCNDAAPKQTNFGTLRAGNTSVLVPDDVLVQNTGCDHLRFGNSTSVRDDVATTNTSFENSGHDVDSAIAAVGDNDGIYDITGNTIA
ncbi:hypothetical protein U1Q18_030395, partial [Sarracenia purpurea var. burkii]